MTMSQKLALGESFWDIVVVFMRRFGGDPRWLSIIRSIGFS